MSVIRDEIRAILREEIAALRSEAETSVERVRITSTVELNLFVRDLIARAAKPEFASLVAAGQVTFELAGTVVLAQTIMAGQMSASGPTFDKKLITERDIAELGQATRSLRLMKHSRLTPLARDEASRRGIRIERISS